MLATLPVCLAVAALGATAPVEPAAPVPAPGDLPRIELTGDPATATRFTEEDFGIVPFGGFLNALRLETLQQGGVQFSAELESCGSRGCVVQTADAGRVLIAKRGIADAVKLDFYDDGWVRNGEAAISEEGLIAIPVGSPDGTKREIWLIRSNGRMLRRLPCASRTPVIMRWREDELYLQHRTVDGTDFARVSLETGKTTSATLMDPWLRRCEGVSASTYLVAPAWLREGEMRGLTSLPLFSPDGAEAASLIVTTAARPMTAQGFASPVQVQTDCRGRFCMVSGMGDEVWVLRFRRDGSLEKASPVYANLAGNASAVQVDGRGRFYFLATEMDETGQTPARLHLIRLD